ncbi:MAG: hypothetical protein K2N78_04555 [Oscillospiraceae bacterium]|nr:hypothetical protein [Oscillospiraceae bacterium]
MIRLRKFSERRYHTIAELHYGPRRPGYYGAYTSTGDDRSTAVLPEALACSLAEKYNVRSLSRNAYSLLLCDLQNAGFITTQEFSAGYGGTLPRGAVNPPESFPLGENKVDFMALLGQYAQYCREFLRTSAGGGAELAHTQSLFSVYSRLHTLFQQIHGAVSERTEK